jgi:hypothetical protein
LDGGAYDTVAPGGDTNSDRRGDLLAGRWGTLAA